MSETDVLGPVDYLVVEFPASRHDEGHSGPASE
jgi:hypothetical protein